MIGMIAYLFMFLVLGVVKLIGIIICLPFTIISAFVDDGKDKSKDEKQKKKDDVPYTEYDEFDWWQDDQGF